MFKELFALAERAPVLLLVSREGDEKLRVNLTRKRDEDEKEVPLSISIVATPAELDAELPLALAEGLALTGAEAKAPSVSDQVKGQIEAAATDEDKDAEKKPVTPKVRKMRGGAKKKLAAAPRAPKAAAPKPTKKEKPKRAAKAKGAMEPNATLAAIIGPEPAAHNEAMVRVWGYIKEHGLKGKPAPNGGSWINADEKLKALFGKDRLASTQLAAIVRQNLVATPATVDPTPKITPLLTPEKLAAATSGGGGGGQAYSISAPMAAGSPPEEVKSPAPEAQPAEPVQNAEAPAQEPAAPQQQPADTQGKPAAPAEAREAGDLDLF